MLPSPPTPPVADVVAESIADGFLGEGEEIQYAAVESGSERRPRLRGLGVGAWLAIGWMTLVVLAAVLAKAGILTWGDPNEIIARCARKGPFADDGAASRHLLGCDGIGRDMAARLSLGAWTSMLVATGAVVLGFVIGGSLGLVAGYFGGRVDTVLTGFFNVLLSIPAIVLALALVAFLQGSTSTQESGGASLSPEAILIIAIGVVAVPLLGRITRASALSWSQREFVLAARAQGAKDGRIMVREVLPNVLPAMFSIALLSIAVAIVAEGTLSILGVGVKPPTPSWGNIIAIDRSTLFNSPHIVFESSLLIFFTVLALNFLGDVVRARFDVREGGI
jgi:peptide/nickel transport system permease protein